MLSFVIPAHDEEALIGPTIHAIHAAAADAAVGAYEIVVVDDASRDHTARVAAAHGARVVRVVCRRISAVRNAGGRAAAGRILFFVDADTLVNGDTLAAAMRALRRGAVGGFSGVSFDGWVPLYARILLALVAPGIRLARLGGACFVFCTREAFDAVGGWDGTLFALEEVTFMTAIKRRFGRRRFVVLREAVVTSGRKFRTHSAWELLAPFVRFATRGRRARQSREGLDLWYAPRRLDPAIRPADGVVGGARPAPARHRRAA
jgi:glycosyltransferase involved in cell wall biosynthesis